MLKLLIPITLFLAQSSLNFAQVGIYTKDPQASLEVKVNTKDSTIVDGIIAPNLTVDDLIKKDSKYLPKHSGAIVYVTNGLATLTRTDKTVKVDAAGYYYFDGLIWQRLYTTAEKEKWFYMPSFNLDMSSLGEKTVDLYANYRSQFTKQTNKFFSSNNSTSLVSNLEAPLFEANELEYIVTFYDERYLRVIEITSEGMMKYIVNDTNPPTNAFINIILQPKK